MRRLALLLTGGALWLILAALPALADGGPHVSTINNGSLGINADSCAGCHRAHTAQGPYLIRAADEEALCLTCHSAASTGSTVDVMTGIQYRLGTGAYVRDGSFSGDPPVWTNGTQLGATRNGGFDQARLGTPSRLAYLRSATDVSMRPKVAVGAAAPVTSAHLSLPDNGLVMPGVAWGNGENNTGAGPAIVELSCASCHNPHGNGMYRILNPIPEANGAGFDDAVAVSVASTNALADLINTVTSHDLQVGDLVTLSGLTGVANGNYVVYAIPNGISFRVQTIANGIGFATPFDVSASGAGGSFFKTSRPVTDAPLPLTGDTRNYTVIQIKGGQGVDASYLLYASQVAAAADAPNVVAAMPAVNIASADPVTDRITTATPHGLSVGDKVTISGLAGSGIPDGSAYNVLAVSFAPFPSETGTPTVYSPTTFTLDGADVTADGTGTVSRNAIPGTYGPTGGDYFHRTAPWNPGVNNTNCNPATFSGSNTARCGTANDAPNGQPDTITAGPLAGEIAFSTQITAWCTGCHTRYYANENPNPGGEPGSSAATSRDIAAWSSSTGRITTTASHGFQVGDTVTLAGNTDIAANGPYVVATVPTSVSFTLTGVTPSTTSTVAIASSIAASDEINTSAAHGFIVGDKVTISGHDALAALTSATNINATWQVRAVVDADTFTLESIATTPVLLNVTLGGSAVGTVSKNVGTVIRSSDPQSASSWWFPRENDSIFKYQHRTVPNRACVTCHVSHGSNAVMSGPYSSTVAYPDGTVSASSRLLKVTNRGTCQMCHDPTGTTLAGTTNGTPFSVP